MRYANAKRGVCLYFLICDGTSKSLVNPMAFAFAFACAFAFAPIGTGTDLFAAFASVYVFAFAFAPMYPKIGIFYTYVHNRGVDK